MLLPTLMQMCASYQQQQGKGPAEGVAPQPGDLGSGAWPQPGEAGAVGGAAAAGGFEAGPGAGVSGKEARYSPY